MNRTLAGAATGAVAGLVAGTVGEMLVLLVAGLFPTDVLISGFAMIWAVPAGVLIGTVSGWREWLPQRQRLAAVAAIPGLLAGMAAALMQWQAM